MPDILDRISEYLKERFPEAEAWLSLLLGHDEGKRLAACLAIDLRSKALDSEDIRSFLTLADPCGDGLKAIEAFAASIHAVRDEWVCRSTHKGSPLDNDDRYVRIQEIKGFTEYCVAPSLTIPSNAAGVRQVRRMLKRGRMKNLGALRKAKIRGTLPNVWVMSYSKLEEIRESADPSHPGTVVNNALGLGYPDGGAEDGRPELVAVLYPKGHDIPTFQPTLFDCRWDNYLHLFVAAGDNNCWGQTCSCSGEPPFCPERVHHGFTGLSDSFTAEYIGVSNVFTRDISMLVRVALDRFHSVEN